MSVEKLSKVLKILQKEGKVSPNKIATQVRSDRRTVQKVLQVATELGMTKCEVFEVGERRYTACSLTPEYQKILKNKGKS